MKLFTLKYRLFAAVMVFICLMSVQSIAQDQTKKREVVQFSGVILDQDSTRGLPFVNIFVPKTGRGTTSDPYGYFSMPTLAGDTVVFSFVGFERQSVVIPAGEGDSYSLVLSLKSDTTQLAQVDITPFPTEEAFKQAVLALNIAEDNMMTRDNLNPQLLIRMMEELPMTGGESQRYFTNQQMMYYNDRFGPRPLQLLNPFAWSQFIQSIKRGDFKKK